MIRFTPMRPKSMWSQINCARAEQLAQEGKMHSGGIRQIAAAKEDGRWSAAYASPGAITVPKELADALAESPFAASAYAALSKAQQYTVLLDIVTKKKPETR